MSKNHSSPPLLSFYFSTGSCSCTVVWMNRCNAGRLIARGAIPGGCGSVDGSALGLGVPVGLEAQSAFRRVPAGVQV